MHCVKRQKDWVFSAHIPLQLLHTAVSASEQIAKLKIFFEREAGTFPSLLFRVLLVRDVLSNSEYLCTSKACQKASSPVEECCASQYLQLYWGCATIASVKANP